MNHTFNEQEIKSKEKIMSTNVTKKLAGKVALVTGGSRSIGAAIAKRLATDGANVAITYARGADAAASVVQAIERAGGTAIAIQADSADADALVDMDQLTYCLPGQHAATGRKADVHQAHRHDWYDCAIDAELDAARDHLW